MSQKEAMFDHANVNKTGAWEEFEKQLRSAMETKSVESQVRVKPTLPGVKEEISRPEVGARLHVNVRIQPFAQAGFDNDNDRVGSENQVKET